MVLLLLVIIAGTVGVIYVQEALRKIPIQYAKRATGRSQTTGGQQTHMPLKLNAAGVIPVIFAVAFFITPQSIASFFGANSVTTEIQDIFDYTNTIGMGIYVALIIPFTYLYEFIHVNPAKLPDNLQKHGAYFPAIRPGANTKSSFNSPLSRLTFFV